MQLMKVETLICCVLGEVEYILASLKNSCLRTTSFLAQNFREANPTDRAVQSLTKLQKRLHTCISACDAGEHGTLDRVEIIIPFLDIFRESPGRINLFGGTFFHIFPRSSPNK